MGYKLAIFEVYFDVLHPTILAWGINGAYLGRIGVNRNLNCFGIIVAVTCAIAVKINYATGVNL